MEKLAEMAVDMGLQLNYNSKIVKLFAMEDGTFKLQTAAGRVRCTLAFLCLI